MERLLLFSPQKTIATSTKVTFNSHHNTLFLQYLYIANSFYEYYFELSVLSYWPNLLHNKFQKSSTIKIGYNFD